MTEDQNWQKQSHEVEILNDEQEILTLILP
jgi:hypothetical protein